MPRSAAADAAGLHDLTRHTRRTPAWPVRVRGATPAWHGASLGATGVVQRESRGDTAARREVRGATSACRTKVGGRIGRATTGWCDGPSSPAPARKALHRGCDL